MRKNHVIIVMLFLNLLQGYGQRTAKIMKQIDKIVAATRTDSTLQKAVVDIKRDDSDDEKNPHPQITVFFKDSKISKISFCDNCSGSNFLLSLKGGYLVDYYLVNEELCFVNHRYTDPGRPGSCGYVNIVNKFYFKKGKLVKQLKEGHNPCDEMVRGNRDPTPELLLQYFKNLVEMVKGKSGSGNN